MVIDALFEGIKNDLDLGLLKLFKTIFWNYIETFENKEGKWCILLLPHTIF